MQGGVEPEHPMYSAFRVGVAEKFPLGVLVGEGEAETDRAVLAGLQLWIEEGGFREVAAETDIRQLRCVGIDPM